MERIFCILSIKNILNEPIHIYYLIFKNTNNRLIKYKYKM